MVPSSCLVDDVVLEDLVVERAWFRVGGRHVDGGLILAHELISEWTGSVWWFGRVVSDTTG